MCYLTMLFYSILSGCSKCSCANRTIESRHFLQNYRGVKTADNNLLKTFVTLYDITFTLPQ